MRCSESKQGLNSVVEDMRDRSHSANSELTVGIAELELPDCHQKGHQYSCKACRVGRNAHLKHHRDDVENDAEEDHRVPQQIP